MSPRTLVAVAWTALIVAGTLAPASWLPGGPETSGPGTFLPKDKLAHLILFGGFGFLWARAGVLDGRTAPILVGGILLAILTELGQGLSFIGRYTDPIDMMSDTVGLILGLALYRLIGPRPRPRKPARAEVPAPSRADERASVT